MYLFHQLFQYFDEYYFDSSLGTYEYLDFKKTVTTLLALVGGLCLGMMIAAIVAVVQKRHVGKFVRALLDKNATEKDSAKSLGELGLAKNVLIKQELSRSSVVRKLVTVVDGDEVFDYYDDLTAAFPAYAEKIATQKELDLAAAAENAPSEPEEGAASVEGARDESAEAEEKAEAPVSETVWAEDRAQAATDAPACDGTEEKCTDDGAQEGDIAAAAEEKSEKEEPNAEEKGAEKESAATRADAPASSKKNVWRSFRPRKLDFNRVRFFIPNELALRASFLYRKKGNSWIAVVVAFFIFLLIFMIGLRFIPLFVSMLDQSIVNILGPKI